MTLLKKMLFFSFIALLLFSCQKNESVYIAKYKGDKDCAISYTFDDGLKEHYTLVFPQLEKYGFKGTFWICGSWVNEVEGDSINPNFVNWEELKEISERGHEISNHSWSHACLSALSDDSVRLEIEKNDSVIFSEIGIKPKTFCYPFDCVNETVSKIATENRVGTRTKIFGIGGEQSKSTTETLSNKVKELLKNKEWGVAMVHGIESGYDYLSSPQILWDHFDQVKDMEDKIWVDTFERIAAYEKERDNVQLDIHKAESGYTIVPKLTLDKNLFAEPLTMVIKEKNLKSVSIKQDGRSLEFKESKNKLIFDFDPYGGAVDVIFTK